MLSLPLAFFSFWDLHPYILWSVSGRKLPSDLSLVSHISVISQWHLGTQSSRHPGHRVRIIIIRIMNDKTRASHQCTVVNYGVFWKLKKGMMIYPLWIKSAWFSIVQCHSTNKVQWFWTKNETLSRTHWAKVPGTDSKMSVSPVAAFVALVSKLLLVIEHL